MPYPYGSPEAVGLQRPQCWGNERVYNPGTRECRSCTFQTTCGDNVARLRNQQAALGYSPVPVPTQQAYQQPVYPAPAAYRQPVQQQNIQPAQQPQQPVVRQQVPQAMQGPYPAPQSYEYGWMTDPLYYTAHASPPPMIPTLEGETSLKRIGKNIGISFVRSLFFEGYMASRQMVWAPRKRKKTKFEDEGDEE